MDEAVNHLARAAGAPAVAVLLAALFAAQPASAQALQDPTRPPSGTVGGAFAAQDAAPALPQLQSVLVGRAPGGRRVAVIDGETVRLGDTFHGARVARVTDTEVELVRGRERQVLRLYAQQAGADVPAAGR